MVSARQWLAVQPCPICGVKSLVTDRHWSRAQLAAHLQNEHEFVWIYRDLLMLSPEECTELIKREWLSREIAEGACE